MISLNENTILESFSFLNVKSGGRNENGERPLEQKQFPVYQGTISGIDTELDALIVCSDLQGNIETADGFELLGIHFAAFLSLLIQVELSNLDAQKCGVILCGDLYATPDKRGGIGDVRDVWRAFKKYFKWVAGVAGNHDAFGSKEDLSNFKKEEGIYFIEKEIAKVDGLKIGGLSGVISSKDAAFCWSPETYCKILNSLLSKTPDFVVFHQSPSFAERGEPGSDKIREIIEKAPKNNLFAGHSHWKKAFAHIGKSTFINADSRCFILTFEK